MTDLNPCPSCGEPLDHPSGDGCANMTAHKERAMNDVIDFAKAKADADKSRSTLFVSLDVYLNADNSEVWASVTNVDEQELDAWWHTFIADLLRKLAWLSDGMAADKGSEHGQPVLSITAFESSRISTRWSGDLVRTEAQVEWARGQMQSGIDEIDAELKGDTHD